MQAFTDVPVKCCDCEKTFLSASSLLLHFAQHVKIDIAKSNYEKFQSVSKKSCLTNNYLGFNKNVKNTIENVILKNNTKHLNISTNSSSPVTSNDSSLQSVISDRSDFNSSLESSESKNVCDVINSFEDDNINDNAQQIPVKLLFREKPSDVIDNLAQKNISKQICVEFNSEKLLINIEKIACNNVDRHKLFNFDGLNDNSLIESYEKIDNKRKNSNRKQLLPKKIERTSNGFIKIAPKPDTLPAKNSRESQKKKSVNKRKYSCHLCSKVFGWSTDLKRHILVHTGERPYKCTKCSACFTRNFLLQKHKSKIHPCSQELVEKNKLLEEKVHENLEQLKSKMVELENPNCVKIEIAESNEICEQFSNDVEEEMTFEESKLGIKEELLDPLADTPSSFEVRERYIKGKWMVTNDNYNSCKINNDDSFLGVTHKEVLTVGPIKIMS